MNWSRYQQDIFSAFEHSPDSLLVQAVAGSGKSTTLLELARIMERAFPRRTAAFVAFNKGIADNLAAKLARKYCLDCGREVDESWSRTEIDPDDYELHLTETPRCRHERFGTARNVRAMTLHAAGLAAWRRAGGIDWTPRVDSGKVTGIMREVMSWEESRKWGETTRRLVGLAKQAGLVPSGQPRGLTYETQEFTGLVNDKESSWEALMDHYSIDPEDCNLEIVRRVLARSIETAREVVDFDDMCQPPGTMITVCTGGVRIQVPIEEIKEGDQVVSYIRNESRFGRSRAVKKIGSRMHVGEIIAVAAGGKSTRCTPNHKWLVRFNKAAESKWCVYLMNQGRRWRIGSCRLRYGKRGCGPRQRMFTEKADNLWILKVCDTQAQAFARESILAAKYGLPMMVFRAGNHRMEGYQEVIETVFNAVPGQESKAMEVLGDFCLQPDLPHISKKGGNSTSFRLSGKNSFICAACNLLPDVMSVALYPENTWEPIKISRSYYSGPVYSMEVEKELYVADGILTHNCYMPVVAGVEFDRYDVVLVDEAQDLSGIQHEIVSRMVRPPKSFIQHYKLNEPDYERLPEGRVVAVGDPRQAIYGFRGAHADSMERLRERFRMRELPLSVCYRCPRAVVDHARQWCPQIEAGEGAAWGYVGEEGTDWQGQCEIALGAPVEFAKGGDGPEMSEVRTIPSGSDAMSASASTAHGEPAVGGVSKWRTLHDFAPGDAILCRLTRPLVEAAFTLIRARVACRVLGRDIGKGLADLVRKSKIAPGCPVGDFEDWLRGYLDKQRKRLRARQEFARLGLLEDKAATLEVFISELAGLEANVGGLIREIEALFTDNGNGAGDTAGMVTLATVHKAKGLEWPRVFVLDAGETMPSKWARQSWELEQERNCMYIAATRARRELRYITTEDLKRGRKP